MDKISNDHDVVFETRSGLWVGRCLCSDESPHDTLPAAHEWAQTHVSTAVAA